MMSNNLGLYIHIPFCRSKCPYCDFFSMRGDEQGFDEYTRILKNNIRHWGQRTDKLVDTIYIGGGTPSVIGADRISDILCCVRESFSVLDKAEVTMEANPASGRFFDFGKVASFGINRVSLGMQSADSDELKALGRLHSTEDVISSIKLIRNAGIQNISLDLMMGIPNQTKDSLRKSIDFCVELGAEHISSYILKIEPGTIFDKRYDNYNFPDDDETAELYLFAVDYLAENGYEQYEISNFCKTGFESKHNLKYWTLEDYLGLGPAAHSFLNGKRFYYKRDLKSFESNITEDEGSGGDAEEYIMLRLRLRKGLDLRECKKILGEGISEKLAAKSQKYIKNNLMELKDNRLFFTPKGFLVSNSILADLI